MRSASWPSAKALLILATEKSAFPGKLFDSCCAQPDSRTWAYVIGIGWHRATAVENCWPLYESAISVEVEPAPAKR